MIPHEENIQQYQGDNPRCFFLVFLHSLGWKNSRMTEINYQQPHKNPFSQQLTHVPTHPELSFWNTCLTKKKGDLTLPLNSPLKANWFSGFPSGTLYLLNQSTVASKYPGFILLTSSMSGGGHGVCQPETVTEFTELQHLCGSAELFRAAPLSAPSQAALATFQTGFLKTQ